VLTVTAVAHNKVLTVTAVTELRLFRYVIKEA